jgi:hypothetical protein
MKCWFTVLALIFSLAPPAHTAEVQRVGLDCQYETWVDEVNLREYTTSDKVSILLELDDISLTTALTSSDGRCDLETATVTPAEIVIHCLVTPTTKYIHRVDRVSGDIETRFIFASKLLKRHSGKCKIVQPLF